MLITVVGNGSGESMYNNQCIEVSDTVDINTVQTFVDEWREGLDTVQLDQFGDINPKTVSISDIAAAMPSEWNAKVTNYVCECLFA